LSIVFVCDLPGSNSISPNAATADDAVAASCFCADTGVFSDRRQTAGHVASTIGINLLSLLQGKTFVGIHRCRVFSRGGSLLRVVNLLSPSAHIPCYIPRVSCPTLNEQLYAAQYANDDV